MNASPPKHKIAVIGASGRMGQCVLKEFGKNYQPFVLSGTLVRQGDYCGKDILASENHNPCGILATSSIEKALEGCDGVMDFSTPSCSHDVLSFVEKMQNPPAYLLATTGLSQKQMDAFPRYALCFPFLYAGNTSLGIALLSVFTKIIAPQLATFWNVDIVETHHLEKKDSPSGTALHLKKSLGKGFASTRIHSLRMRNVVGEHKMLLRSVSGDESITITHQAHDRSLFAQGAFRGMEYLIKQRPGLYTMEQALGLETGLYTMEQDLGLEKR